MFQRLDHVSDRIALQVIHDTRMQVPPGIENPRGLIQRFGKRGAVERFHEIEQSDLACGQTQTEAARGAFARAKQSFASELLQDLGEEVGGDLFLFGDVPGHGEFAIGNSRQENERADRVLGRSGIDHRRLTLLSWQGDECAREKCTRGQLE